MDKAKINNNIKEIFDPISLQSPISRSSDPEILKPSDLHIMNKHIYQFATENYCIYRLKSARGNDGPVRIQFVKKTEG